MTALQKLLRFFAPIYYLGQKELLSMLKDPRMRLALVMPVLIQGFLFGYVANYNLDSVPYAVVDASRSEASRSLIAHFDGSPAFSRVAVLAVPSDIEALVDAESIRMAIVIPSDFERRLSRGEAAPIEIITDGRNALVSTLATGYAGAIVTRWNNERLGLRPAVSLTIRTWYNENQITRWTFLPSLIAMISFVQVIMLSGLSVAKEREQGTFDQLLVTPLSVMEILIGKALPPMLIGLMQSTLLLLLCLFWFEIPFSGSFATLYLTLFLFILSSTGIGLSISAIARNMQQVLVYTFVLLLPLVLLSGIATPVANMPPLLRLLTHIDPLRFAVEAIRRIYLEGAVAADLIGDYIPLLLIAACTLPFAMWLFRKRTS